MGKFLISIHRLESWFHRQKRVLPWRDEPTFYRVWISEIMLQQTQVITVVPYFERFVKAFPSVEVLAQSPQEAVLQLWAGLGYYSRARNLHRAAQMIVNKGRFPQTREEWLEIPGVGDYTAGAILSIADNQPEAILDGNVERVLSRLRRVSRQAGDANYKSRLWKISEILVTRGNERKILPSVLNQALMELGATVCSPRKPQCLLCPIKESCRAYQHGEQDFYPPKKKAKEWVQIREKLHCVLNSSGEVLLRKRRPGEWRAGLWDLLEGEPQDFGLTSVSMGAVETRHVVTRHKIQRVTQIWKVKGAGWKAAAPQSLKRIPSKNRGEIQKADPDELRWISVKEPQVAVGSALKRTLKAVLDRQAPNSE